MPSDIDNDVKDKIRALYRTNELARRFLDQCAQRERDASATSIDRIAYRLDISREAAIGLAQALEEASVGTFIVGRRGHKSRFVWDYSCISVGQFAAGESTSLEEPDDAVEDVEPDAPDASVGSGSSLTIADAKRALAKSLGVPVEAIQITIQA